MTEMKCGMTLVRRPNKKGKFRLVEAHSWLQVWGEERNSLGIAFEEGDVVEVCDGNVEAHITLEDEPYFGGCDTKLSVGWKCDLCGQSHGHPELPTDEKGLSKLVSELLKYAPPELLEGMMERHRQEILGRETLLEEQMKREQRQKAARHPGEGRLPMDPEVATD